MKGMLKLVDLLAAWWLHIRSSEFIHGYPEATQQLVTRHPLVLMVANDAAGFIQDAGAKNGVILAFHSKRHDRDIALCVRWADGSTPEEMILEKQRLLDEAAQNIKNITEANLSLRAELVDVRKMWKETIDQLAQQKADQ